MTFIKIIIGLAIMTAVLYFSQINAPLAQSMQGQELDTPEGGRVLIKYRCPCSKNYQLFIGPPKGGNFTSSKATKLYREYNLEPPAWSLGLARYYQLCLAYSSSGCFPIGPGGKHIRMVGTSVF